MPHRRTSGAKVRSHKLGVANTRFAKGKQARLQGKRQINEFLRWNEPLA